MPISGLPVAPVRERGLKLVVLSLLKVYLNGRSRKGAWIEILDAGSNVFFLAGRSRKGAWIEISVCLPLKGSSAWSLP